MTDQIKSSRRDWLYFSISLVIMIAIIVIATPWFWVALPFVLTFLVKAMGMM